MELRYRLELWEKCVLLQILEQDECLRGLGTLGIGLSSVRNPELTKGEIYLRGLDDSLDWKVSTLLFETEEDAFDYYNWCKHILEEYVNSLKDDSLSFSSGADNL